QHKVQRDGSRGVHDISPHPYARAGQPMTATIPFSPASSQTGQVERGQLTWEDGSRETIHTLPYNATRARPQPAGETVQTGAAKSQAGLPDLPYNVGRENHNPRRSLPMSSR